MIDLEKSSAAVSDAIVGHRRVLVLSDHPILGKAIEAGLRSLVDVDLFTAAADLSAAREAGCLEPPDLIIVTVIHNDQRMRALSEDLVRSSNWDSSTPVLMICDEPALLALNDATTRYLRFPFDVETLRSRVVQVLQGTVEDAGPTEVVESRSRILVVEDESIVAADLEVTLESLGYDVIGTLAWAEEAIDFVRNDPPDIILMDIHLKGEIDGIEATAIIQSEMDVPVVFLTAHADTATLERAKRTAPYGYVLKPFEERELHSAVQMAIYRAHAERTIRERERWLRAILRSIGDGVVATNAAGRIVFLNPVAEKLADRTWDRALHHPLHEVFNLPSELNTAPDGSPSAPTRREAILEAQGGEELVVDQTRCPIYDEHGEFWGEILTLRDITERVRSQELLRLRAEELTRQNEELNAFAHTVAHDIKDPLNVVRGFAEVLAAHDIELDENEEIESLRTIVGYAKRISNIVDELLLLATVRESEVQLETLEMSRIIARAEGRLEYLRDKRGAIIKHTTDDWPMALGQSSWIEEVWVNYLSNAIKYGGEPPVIELGAEFLDGAVRYWVRDNGSGISTEDREKLFVPFSRLHQVRATGQGLGLSIVRRIVSRLGGEVGVVSEPGEGSTFYFTLPLTQPEES
ncbi:MAG: response regulator [Anaerolineae bacterium]